MYCLPRLIQQHRLSSGFSFIIPIKHCPWAWSLHEVSLGLPVREQGTSVLVVHALHQRELDSGIVELLNVRTTALAGRHRLNLDDLQGGKDNNNKGSALQFSSWTSP